MAKARKGHGGDANVQRERAVVIALCVAVALALVSQVSFALSTKFRKTIRIERTYTRNSKFMIATDAAEVFEVDWSLIYWFWTPAELWAELVPGRAFEVTGYGARVPMLGWYPCIVGAKAVRA